MTAFQHSHIDLTSTTLRFEMCAVVVSADAACSYTFLFENQFRAHESVLQRYGLRG
jgi:hypothetical protein